MTTTTPLADIGAAIAAAAETTGEAVVGLGRGWGSAGSGFITGRGEVLTNAHNLRHEEVTVTFADGSQHAGHVRAADPDLDLAVISVPTGERPAVNWADGEAAGIGTPVLALANPGGRGLRATHGFISSAAGARRGPRGRRIAGAIEHTAPLPRGSSGGPLLDLDGRLLGINALRTDGGLILAIPADEALHERVRALARGETPPRFRLGIAVVPPRAARRLRSAVGLPPADGILIRFVQEDGPASRAGLERGDVILAAGETPTPTLEALLGALDAAADQQRIELRVLRGADERQVTVVA